MISERPLIGVSETKVDEVNRCEEETLGWEIFKMVF
jgi:hypothetical protein